MRSAPHLGRASSSASDYYFSSAGAARFCRTRPHRPQEQTVVEASACGPASLGNPLRVVLADDTVTSSVRAFTRGDR